jgi:hypothetical protein
LLWSSNAALIRGPTTAHGPSEAIKRGTPARHPLMPLSALVPSSGCHATSLLLQDFGGASPLRR